MGASAACGLAMGCGAHSAPSSRPIPPDDGDAATRGGAESAELVNLPDPDLEPSSQEPGADDQPPQEPSADEPPQDPTASCERIRTLIGRNHGHLLLIPHEDVLGAVSQSYRILGAADHDHEVQIDSADFAKIGTGEVVRKKTEFGSGHRHRILVRCEPLVLPPDQISACEAIVAGLDGHELVIPESHLQSGQDRVYDVQGVSGHTHTLTLKGGEFEQLLSGQRLVLKTSLSQDHYHLVYIRYLGT